MRNKKWSLKPQGGTRLGGLHLSGKKAIAPLGTGYEATFPAAEPAVAASRDEIVTGVSHPGGHEDEAVKDRPKPSKTARDPQGRSRLCINPPPFHQ